MQLSNISAWGSSQFIQSNAITFPRPPIISSAEANWKDVFLVHHCQPACHVPQHCPPYHQLCIKLGKPYHLEQVIDGHPETLQAIPGRLGLYLANSSQSCSWDEEAEFLQLYFAPETLIHISEAIWGRDRSELLPQLSIFTDPLILQMGLALKTALETDKQASYLYADSLTHALFTHLLARYSTQEAHIPAIKGNLSPQQLKKVTDYIHQNFDQKLSLAEIAAKVNLSPYYFARLFKQSTGLPPHQYQLQCRIDRAQELLSSGKFAIAEIAQMVGFSSQGHLNYHFKRLVGVTPSKITSGK